MNWMLKVLTELSKAEGINFEEKFLTKDGSPSVFFGQSNIKKTDTNIPTSKNKQNRKDNSARYSFNSPEKKEELYIDQAFFLKRERVFGFQTAFLIALAIAFLPWIMPRISEYKNEIKNFYYEIIEGIEQGAGINEPEIDLSTAPMIPYAHAASGLKFKYPSVWEPTLTEQDRIEDPTTLEIFDSLNGDDGFYESMFVNVYDKEDKTFSEFIETIKGNLEGNEFSVTNEVETKVAGREALLLDTKGESSEDNLFLNGRVYLINADKNYLLFELSDQVSTFEETSQKFDEVINSIEFLK